MAKTGEDWGGWFCCLFSDGYWWRNLDNNKMKKMRERERGSAEMQNCRLQIDDIDMIWCKACEEGSSQNPSMTRQNLIPSIFLLIFDFDRWMDGWMGLLEVMHAWCACFIISIHHLANSNTKQIIQMLYILVTKREEKKKKSSLSKLLLLLL